MNILKTVFGFVSGINLWEIAAVASLELALVVGVWFAADAHYSKALASLEGQYEQAGKDQEALYSARVATNKKVADKVNKEAKGQIDDMAQALADLSVRNRSLGLRAASSGAGQVSRGSDVRPDPAGAEVPDQPGRCPVIAGERIDPADTRPTVAEIDDALRIGKDALGIDRQWLQYARGTGQGQ